MRCCFVLPNRPVFYEHAARPTRDPCETRRVSVHIIRLPDSCLPDAIADIFEWSLGAILDSFGIGSVYLGYICFVKGGYQEQPGPAKERCGVGNVPTSHVDGIKYARDAQSEALRLRQNGLFIFYDVTRPRRGWTRGKRALAVFGDRYLAPLALGRQIGQKHYNRPIFGVEYRCPLYSRYCSVPTATSSVNEPPVTPSRLHHHHARPYPQTLTRARQWPIPACDAASGESYAAAPTPTPSRASAAVPGRPARHH